MRRRKVLWLAAGALLVLTGLAVRTALKPRYLAEGRLLIYVNSIEPTNEPARSDFYAATATWSVDQQQKISNRLAGAELMFVSPTDAARRDLDLKFAGVRWFRNTSILRVRFAGNDPKVVWQAASNASARLAEFYVTNQHFAFQATNTAPFEAEHLQTAFWKPKPFWQQMVDQVESWVDR
jgi:hypothetical protein